MRTFESIVGLARLQESSATLKQHVSAMKMDDRFAWTFNQLVFAMTDAKKD